MARDGSTLGHFLNTTMALSTVCSRESWSHADGSSGSFLNFTKSPAWEGGSKRVHHSFELCQNTAWMHTSKIDTSRASVPSGNKKRVASGVSVASQIKGLNPESPLPTQTVIPGELLLGATRNVGSSVALNTFFKTTSGILQAEPSVTHHLFHAIHKGNAFHRAHRPLHCTPVVTLTTCGCLLPSSFLLGRARSVTRLPKSVYLSNDATCTLQDCISWRAHHSSDVNNTVASTKNNRSSDGELAP